MIKLLEKLERQAERFLSNMDEQLQEPIANIVTGKVFNETPANTPNERKQKDANGETKSRS